MPLHKDLTGTDLHEPKGIASAAASTVYVADGAGSGTWTALDERLPAGTVAMSLCPVVPSGWLELNGATVNIADEPDLYEAVTIQQSGTRTNGQPTITGLASTTHMRVGYYVFGTGITAGTTILSVDSGSQITLSGNASSSGTAIVHVSPWSITATQMTLPDMTTGGLFPRSRTSSVRMGATQTSQNLAHTHTGTSDAGGDHNHGGATGSNGAHSHTGTTDNGGVDHTHTYNDPNYTNGYAGATGPGSNSESVGNTGGASAYLHTHTFTTSSVGTHTHTISSSGTHTHTYTTSSNGGSEARPANISLIFMVRT